jgi:hypothetical protein
MNDCDCKYKYKLIRAVRTLGLSANRGMLFGHVLDGYPDACQVDFVSLAKSWGVHPNRLYESKGWLLQAGLLAEGEDGYRVNVAFADWVTPGTCDPLLDANQLAYANNVTALVKQRDGVGRTNVTALVQPTRRRGKTNVTALVKQRDGVGLPAIERAAASAELNSIQFNSSKAQSKVGDLAEVVSRETALSQTGPPRPASPVAIDIVPTSEQSSHSQGDPVCISGPGGGPAHDPKLLEAGREMRRAFGDEAAGMLWAEHEQIAATIGGRWDCYLAAIYEAEEYRAKPGAEPIRNLGGFLIGYAKGWIKELARGRALPIAVAPKPVEPVRFSQLGHPDFVPPLTAEQIAMHQQADALSRAKAKARVQAAAAAAAAAGREVAHGGSEPVSISSALQRFHERLNGHHVTQSQ